MNRYMYVRIQENSYLAHHGIKGQKWGIRRYQNEDGSLTPEGKKRYGYDETTGSMSEKGMARRLRDATKTALKDWKQSKGQTFQKSLDIEMFKKNDPEGYERTYNEFSQNVRNLYGKNVSDKEFELAIARADRDEKRTKAIIMGAFNDVPLAASSIVVGARAAKNSGDSKSVKAMGIGIATVTGLIATADTALNIGQAAAANKALKEARKRYKGTSEYV